MPGRDRAGRLSQSSSGYTPRTRIAIGHDAVEPTPDALSAGVALCEKAGAKLLLVAVAQDAAVADPARDTMPYAEITEARLLAAEQMLAEAR